MKSVLPEKMSVMQSPANELTNQEIPNVVDLCESVQKELMLFGLTPNEGKTFIHLSRLGPLRAGQISKTLGIHRTEIYHLLTSLQNKGLVKALFDHPYRFIASDFEGAINTLIDNQRQALASVESKRGALISLWNSVPKEDVEEEEESSFQVIKGLDQIYRKAGEMCSSAEKSMVISGSDFDLARVDQSCVFENMANVKNKSVRVVTHRWAKTSDVADWVKRCTRFVMNRETLIPHVFIADNNQLLFVMSDGKSPRKEVTAMWNNSPAFVYAFISSFEQLWNSSRSD